MALVLHVDATRWRAHLTRTVRANPGIVPVAKGNGYGFGLDLLFAEATRLHGSAGVDTVAVGTYAEARSALEAFPGDVLVLEPYRAVLHATLPHLDAGALVHNLASAADLADLAGRVSRPRVVIEGLTSMNRHGVPFDAMAETLATVEGAEVIGLTLHLPLGSGHLAEVGRWVEAFDVSRWYLSHVSPGELSSIGSAHPSREFRPRIGTALWLGDPGALAVRGQVLDVRVVHPGDRAGYRQHKLRPGYLVVVSGGTAQGVAMEAPTAAASLRQRAIAVAEGVLEAAGRLRSPFTVAGRDTWFVEPPHMQVSLISLPEGVVPPRVGDELDVRVRHTTLRADDVVLS